MNQNKDIPDCHIKPNASTITIMYICIIMFWLFVGSGLRWCLAASAAAFFFWKYIGNNTNTTCVIAINKNKMIYGNPLRSPLNNKPNASLGLTCKFIPKNVPFTTASARWIAMNIAMMIGNWMNCTNIIEPGLTSYFFINCCCSWAIRILDAWSSRPSYLRWILFNSGCNICILCIPIWDFNVKTASKPFTTAVTTAIAPPTVIIGAKWLSTQLSGQTNNALNQFSDWKISPKVVVLEIKIMWPLASFGAVQPVAVTTIVTIAIKASSFFVRGVNFIFSPYVSTI